MHASRIFARPARLPVRTDFTKDREAGEGAAGSTRIALRRPNAYRRSARWTLRFDDEQFVEREHFQNGTGVCARSGPGHRVRSETLRYTDEFVHHGRRQKA